MKKMKQILAELQRTTELAEKASKPPWNKEQFRAGGEDYILISGADGRHICYLNEHDGCVNDQHFLAAARDALPARDRALKVAVEALERIEDLPPLNEYERKRISREALAAIAKELGIEE